ncbi:hypothetical protein ACVMII_000146, partial [Bradyrhizobium diazoefficiens]
TGDWECRAIAYLVSALEGQGIMPKAGQPTYFAIHEELDERAGPANSDSSLSGFSA